MKPENLYELPTLPLPQELVSILAQGDGVRIERSVSTGQVSDWYDQEETEFVALLAGEACLVWADGSQTTLRSGDTLLIEQHRRHRVSYTSTQPACVWLCVFWK